MKQRQHNIKNILHLGDYYELDKRDSEKKEITALGLKYNLLTAFTSFLAIDHTPTNAQTATTVRTVEQPSVLPYGMSQQGMGFEMGADAVREDGVLHDNWFDFGCFSFYVANSKLNRE